MYCQMAQNPIDPLQAKEQVCSSEIQNLPRPKCLSETAMDDFDCPHRNAESKSDLGPQVDRDLGRHFDRTAGQRGSLDQVIGMADGDKLRAFVSEVLASIEMLAAKHLIPESGPSQV
jgi:hypothetical protein